MAPPLHHDGDPQAAAAPNAYEQEREARIAANRARLVELGIVSSTNASASAATSTMPLGVLSHSSSSGRPSAWARSMFGAGQKVARRRPTVALKVRMFLCWPKENEKNDWREKKKQFHFIDFEREKKKKKTRPGKETRPHSNKQTNNFSPFADPSPREAPAGSAGSRPRERASARACVTPSARSATTSGGGGQTSTTGARGPGYSSPLPPLPSPQPTPPPSPSAPSTSPSSRSAASTAGPGATGTGAAPGAFITTPTPSASAP